MANHDDQRAEHPSSMAQAHVRGRMLSFEVHGRCMWPALRPGDRVVVSALRQVPGPGDIVVYSDGQRQVGQRVWKRGHTAVDGCFVQCRADANLALNAPVLVRELVGRVVEIRRGKRTVPVTGPTLRSQTLAWLRFVMANPPLHDLLGLIRRDAAQHASAVQLTAAAV